MAEAAGIAAERTALCPLCGLETAPHPVERTIAGEALRFCCQGCARIYEVAQQSGLLDQVCAAAEPAASTASTLFAPGEKVYFTLRGMWCEGCALVAQRLLLGQPGVTQAEVSYASERGWLRYNPNQADVESVLHQLERLGYRPALVTDPAEEREDRREDRILWQFFIALGIGMNVTAIYLAELYHYYGAGQFNHPTARGFQYLAWALATPPMSGGALSSRRGAGRSVPAGTATMDTLIALGTLSAYGYSTYVTFTGSGAAYFDSVVMIVTVVALGRFLEARGGSQARKDIRKLLRLQPAKARRQRGDGWEEVLARQLLEGDIILVKPGERVPADGEIVEGYGALEEALLTGESMPVSKGPGALVFAGTLLADAALICRVNLPPKRSRLAQIAELVEQTLASKPRIQRLADQASAYLAASALGIAALTTLGWWATGHTTAQALLAAVAVLVVACPCALGLATPLALTVVLGRAAQSGILVRNPEALETAVGVRRAVFDKTGTLTRGQMSVVAVMPAGEIDRDHLLRLAAAVEQYSEHPVARAIVAAVPGNPPPADDFQAVPGLGASALVVESGLRVRVGTPAFVGAEPDPQLAAAHEERGETVVWVGWNENIHGLIALRDGPNPTAQATLQALRERDIHPTMLSGDNPRTVRAIAAGLGLDDFEGHCSPADKALRIRAWQKAGERVVMVGDGVNDAPALAQADVSLTVAGGTDVAGAVSDVILTRADLMLVPQFLQLAHQVRRTIAVNLLWALAYNAVTVPLAAIGVISPAIAAATMTVSSLFVISNSLRLRK